MSMLTHDEVDVWYEIRHDQTYLVVVLLSTDKETTEIGREPIVSKKIRRRPPWACLCPFPS